MTSPVLLTIFRRSESALQVLSAIRQASPERLYIAADGPRANVPDEDKICRELRAEVLSLIDWPCQIKTLFRDENLGCGRAMAGAIDWFFENEEEGIILEDDCLPVPEFFSFCDAALKHYRHCDKVMTINGTNAEPRIYAEDKGCFFSHYAQVWGWASWRRAWKHYDFELKEFDFAVLSEIFSAKEAKRWRQIIDLVKTHAIGFDTWDFQWSATLFAQKGLALVPSCNLIENIGYNDATHDMPDINLTLSQDGIQKLLRSKFPSDMEANALYDQEIYAKFYKQKPFVIRVLRRLKKFF